MRDLGELIDWLDPEPVPKELQAVIDETNRKIRECFNMTPKVKVTLRALQKGGGHV